MSDDFDKDWLPGDDSDSAGDEEENLDAFDWQQAKKEDGPRKEDRLGVTGQLNWLRAEDESADADTGTGDDASAFDWQHSKDEPGTPGDTGNLGVTGQLTWRQTDFEQQLEDAEATAHEEPPSAPAAPPVKGPVSLRDRLGAVPPAAPSFDDMPQEEEPAADTGDLPAWLQGMGDDTEAEADEEPAADDVPDWMRGAAFDEAEPETFETADEAADDTPDWMRGAAFDDADEPVEEEADDVPEWLRGTYATTSSLSPIEAEVDEDSEEEAEASGDSDVPEWLRAEPARSFAKFDEPQAEVEEEVEEAADEVPEWLRSAEPDESFSTFDEQQAEFEESEEEAEDYSDSGVPEWLRGAAPLEEEPAAASTASTAADLDALFGDMDAEVEEDIAEEIAEPSFENLFGDADFGAADEDDLLSQLASAEELPDLVGDFDLLGQLSESDLDEDFAALQDEEPAALFDDGGDIDIDSLLASTAPAKAGSEPEEDVFRTFGDRRSTQEMIDAGSLGWLQNLGEEGEEDFAAEQVGADDDDFLAELDAAGDLGGLDELDLFGDAELPVEEDDEEFAQPLFSDVDSFLASLDDRSMELPKTGELSLGSDVDLDEALIGEETEDQSKPRSAFAPLPLAPDAPDWLTELSGRVGETSSSAMVRRQEDKPLDELTDRLRMLHERGMNLPAPKVDASPTGTMAQVLPGVTDTLPPAEFVGLSSAITNAAASQITLTPQQQQHSAILRALVGVAGQRGQLASAVEIAAAEAQAEAAAAPGRRLLTRVRLERLLIAIVLALAAMLPFFVENTQIGDLPPTLFATGSRGSAFFQQIDALNSGQLVLVAVEYGPTGAAELDDATRALLFHIILRGARPVIVSGDPVGLLHASNIMNDLGGDALQPNRDYVIGRYLVGDVVGLRAFSENAQELASTDMRGEETGLNITSLNDFAVIVVIAERAESIRNWAEQVAPLTTSPMLAITGASAAPLAEPYLNANADKVYGLLVGYRDAYTYQSMLDIMLSGGSLIPPTVTEATEEPTPDEGTEVPPAVIEATEEATSEAEETTPEASAEATVETIDSPFNEPTATAEEATPTREIESTATPTGTPTPTRTPSPTPTPTPETVRFGTNTGNQAVNVRAGPTRNDAPVGTVAPGARALIIGENEDGTWFNVLLDDGTEGWILAELLEVETLVVPPGSTAIPTGPTEEPTPTREAAPKRPVTINQGDEEPTPTAEGAFPADVGLTLTAASDQLTNLPSANDFALTATAAAQSVPSVEDIALTATALNLGFGDNVGLTLTAGVEMLTNANLGIELTLTPFPEGTPGAPQGDSGVTTINSDEDTDYRDERWYGMTLGTIAAAGLIAFGSIVNILRALRRRNRE